MLFRTAKIKLDVDQDRKIKLGVDKDSKGQAWCLSGPQRSSLMLIRTAKIKLDVDQDRKDKTVFQDSKDQT